MHDLVLIDHAKTIHQVKIEAIVEQEEATEGHNESTGETNPPIAIINGNRGHLSPLRYPGGKSWLMPTIRQWLNYYSSENQKLTLVEPFLGGGIVSLSALNQKLCNKVASAEIDPDIAAVWRTMLGRKNKWLADRIVNFDFNADTISEVLTLPANTVHEAAFKTILRNRISRGGIMAPGAGFLKKGEASKGISSRWYAKTIADRIIAIRKYRSVLDFKQGDGMRLISKWLYSPDVVFFIDPPGFATKHWTNL